MIPTGKGSVETGTVTRHRVELVVWEKDRKDRKIVPPVRGYHSEKGL